MNTNTAQAQRSKYNREAVLSASPARLLTMLYDRLLLDLGRAESAQVAGNWPVASENLLHAQAIVSELMSSLDVDKWEGAADLAALYSYVSTSLISANVNRDVQRTRECVGLLEPLRLTWHEAAQQVPSGPVRTSSVASGSLGFA